MDATTEAAMARWRIGVSPLVNPMIGIYVRISRCCGLRGWANRSFCWLDFEHDLIRKPVPTFRDHALVTPGDISGDPPSADQVLDVAKTFGGQRHQAAGCGEARRA